MGALNRRSQWRELVQNDLENVRIERNFADKAMDMANFPFNLAAPFRGPW
jgi:hypothetical protein